MLSVKAQLALDACRDLGQGHRAEGGQSTASSEQLLVASFGLELELFQIS